MIRSTGIRATGIWPTWRISAVVIAASFIVCVAAPSRADDVQSDTTETRATENPAAAQPGKPVALNKFTKRKRAAKVVRVQKPRVIAKGYRRKAIEADAVSNVVPMSDTERSAMPDTISNANAEWPAADTGVQPVTAASKIAPAASRDVVGSDQLNDLDKTLGDQTLADKTSTDKTVSAPPTGDDAASQIASKMTAQLAQNPSQAAGVNVPTTAAPAMSAMASTDRPVLAGGDTNAWSQSSLIGKIFIAFGGLLMLASAARMFMA